MASLLILLCAFATLGSVVSGTSSGLNQSFSEYVLAFGRAYVAGSEEYMKREAVFMRQLELIQLQNARPNALWTAGVNHMTDRFDAELRNLRGYVPSRKRSGAQLISAGAGNMTLQEPADSVDWRNLESAKFIRDQGECGSCWAFATVGMLEARFEISQGSVQKLSPQQILDCVSNPRHCGGDGGCLGGTVELALEYVAQHGLKTDRAYPYTQRTGQCRAASLLTEHSVSFLGRRAAGVDADGVVASMSITSWSTLASNEPRPLMVAVMEGPVAVSAAANSWFPYQSGIYDGCDKDATVDHAILLVGYGSDNNVKYWRIRNSWGSLWGEDGYIRILRHGLDEDQYCGTDHDPSKGYVCLPYPDSLPVCGMCGVLADSVAAHIPEAQK